jgi:RHS repeat-associated protein
VDSRGIRTDLTYDGRGAVTSTTVHDAGGAVLTQRLYSSDSHLQRVQDQDALGKVTYFAYNANDRLTSVQNALGGLSYFYYDSVDNVTCLVNPRQSATYFFYDPLSRLVAQSDALGNSAYYFYDLADNRTCEVDQRSYGTYYFYDALDRIQVSRNSLSLPTYFFYDLIGNTSVVRDALGNPAYYFYDGRNRRTAVRDAFGSATYFGYDAIGNVKRLVDPRKSVTYFTYDAIDRLQSRLDALGNAGYYYYDGVGNTTALRDPRGNAVYYFYDGLSRLTAQCDSIGNTSYFLYDTVGNLFQSRNARGVTTYFFYDALQRLSVARDGLTNATYFFYDATSNRTHIRDGRGNATYFFYDAVDRPSVARDALGNAGYFFYDAAGNRTCTRDAQGFSAYFSYDQLGRLSVVRGPLDRITYFGYDFIGNMARVIEADTTGSAGYGLQSYGTTLYGGWLPAEESTSYDRIGRATLRQDALGNLSYFFYDAGSNRTAIRDPLAHATYFGYDALDRVTKVQDSLGGTTYFEFDPVGNATKIVDANNRDVQTRYDVLDRPDAIRMADGGSTYFFYDPANNRLREVSPRGNATYYLYDSLNRATGIADALWRSLYFEYDAVGKLSRTVDAEGSAGAHTYDAVSRRTQTNYTPAGAAVAASLRSDPYYVYDEVGNVVQSGDFWGLHRMGYDGLRRQVRHLYPKGQVVYYEYSPRSLVTSIVYPVASGAARMAYDLLRRQTRAASPSGAAAYFSFDAASNLTQRFLGNSAKLDMTYDAADRIARWRGTNKSGGSLSYFDYTRDPKGLVTKLFRESTHTVYYQYDASDRLITEIWSKAGTPEVYGFRYVYDPAGNRTRARINGADTYYFYDEANELRVTGTNSAYATTTYYIYDKNGALTNLVEPSGVTYFAYNAAGLVARMRWKDASATYFFYDGALQRYAMTAGGTTTYFLWNGPNLLQELNADGTVKEEHTNAQTSIGGIGQLVETNRPGQAQPKIYPIMDPRGSITNWIQSDGTTVFAAREYDAFGTIITNSVVGTWPGRFGYQGQAWLEIFSANAAQRLLLSPTRIYDPVTGRFLQNEPLLETRPFTHYLYANQNPLRFVDPLGLAGCGDEPTPGQCENTPLKGFQKAPSGPKIPVLSKYPMVPGQIGWVYYIDANGKLQGTYVGSAESLSRLFNQGHPAEQLIFEPPLDRTITAWRAFGEPNIPWSGQGTSQSALQESLRSVEAPIIRSLSPVESPLSLNAINAARVQNAEVWEAIHQSRLSQRPIRIANPGQGIVLRSLGILGWVQVVADEAVIKPIEEKKAQYVNDLLQFSDDEYADLYGRPQGHDFNILIEPGEHFWNADKYYKSYLSGSCKDKRIYIDKAEAKRILQNYEALYGYVDWKGDFVPGIRRKSLPVLPYRPPIIS